MNDKLTAFVPFTHLGPGKVPTPHREELRQSGKHSRTEDNARENIYYKSSVLYPGYIKTGYPKNEKQENDPFRCLKGGKMLVPKSENPSPTTQIHVV